MIKGTKHLIIFILAAGFITLGLLGLVLPLLPGLLLILIGCLLLSTYNPRFAFWLQGITKKYPAAHKIVSDLQDFIKRIIGR